MKDLDFDELDKAISSVLTPDSAPKDDASSDETSASPALVETSNKTVAVTTPAPADKPSPKPLVSPRRSINRGTAAGRPFADIVAPTKASKPTTRQAPTIEPVTEPVTAPVVVNELAVDTLPSAPKPASDDMVLSRLELEEPQAIQSDVVVETPQNTPAPSETFARFDSLSKNSFDIDAPAPVQEDTKQEDVDEKTPALAGLNDLESSDNAVDTVPDAAPVSPFLEDTHVEKRPLGSLRSADELAETATEPHHFWADAPDPTKDETASVDAPVAEEHADIDHRLPEHGTADKPVFGSSATTPPIHTAASGAATLGATSIAQQYKVDAQRPPAPGSHAPFDTSEYHAALSDSAPAEHSKRIDKTMMIAIVIFVIAVIIAVAVYFYGDTLRSLLP